MSDLNAKKEIIIDLIGELAGQDVDLSLELVTGMFVGLLTAYTEFKGEDPSTEIVIDGDGEGQRKITLHRKGEE